MHAHDRATFCMGRKYSSIECRRPPDKLQKTTEICDQDPS
jgi:hypothetical protein